MNKKNFLLLFICLSMLSVKNISAANETIKIKSPDNRTEVTVLLGDTLKYSVKHDNKIVLTDSKIGIILDNNKNLGLKTRLSQKDFKDYNEKITSPFYRFSSFSANYNELNLKMKGDYGIIFRAYNSGVAYRFYTNMKGLIGIKNELAEFNFDKDYVSYLPHSTNPKDPYAMAFQNIYDVKPLTKANQEVPSFLPVTVDLKNNTKLTITESDLEAYPGMFIRNEGKCGFKGEFAALPSTVAHNSWRQQEYVTGRQNIIAKVNGNRKFPWRVLVITDKDTDMPVNNLVYALASPNRIGDYSWIKSGKVAWDWWNDWGIYGVNFKVGINTETYKHYIDFASENGIRYIVMDEGWYNPSKGDMMTVIPDIDLPKLVKYAQEKNVGIILWTVFNVLDSQLEEACKYYSKLGIKGFKVDFLDRDAKKP